MIRRINWIINATKVLVAPIILAMMWYFHNWSVATFLYLGLHGTYTLLWLIKQSVFPDKSFAQPIPLWIGVLTPFLPLMTYMIGAYLLISEHTVPPNWVFALAPFLCISGVFLHYVSDAQNSSYCSCGKNSLKTACCHNTKSQLFGRSTDLLRICGRFLVLAASARTCRMVPILCPQYAPERQVDVPLS
jgi:hypothetical protein